MGRILVSSCKCCWFVSAVQPVIVLSALFCIVCNLLMLVCDAMGAHIEDAYSSVGLMIVL